MAKKINFATPINNKFWGYKNNNYLDEYSKDVDNILSNGWEAAKKYMTDNNVKYAQTPEGFRAAAFDKKVGIVHEYIKSLPKQSKTIITDIPTTYTHTTDKNFYDSGQFSPEEKALYNPETLTRDITKEEFDKAMKTNYPVTNSIGAGYRENIPKPKMFLGAALGVAQLGMGVYNMFAQNSAQKKQVAEQNALTSKNNAIQMTQRLDAEGVSARNFGVNTPMTSFYANGGKNGMTIPADGQDLQQKTEDVIQVNGRSHAQGGVDAGNVEVEKGEMIRQKPDGSQFIYSHQLVNPQTGRSFGDDAKEITNQKATIEKQIGSKLLAIDKSSIALNKSASIPKANSNARAISSNKTKINNLEQIKQQIDSQLDNLEQTQLQVGKQMGLYNEDGTPKDTTSNSIEESQGQPQMKWGGYHKDNVTGMLVQDSDFNDYNAIGKDTPVSASTLFPKVPSMVKVNLPKLSTPTSVVSSTTKTQTPITETKKSFNLKGFGEKADRFAQSNTGQAIMGTASAAINLLGNVNAAKNMAKLQTPMYVPLKTQDTPLVNMSATRSGITESEKALNTYAKQNFANPQVAASVMQNTRNQSIDELSQVNQQEDATNANIINANISRRLGVEAQNQAGLLQSQQAQYAKSSDDINNQQAITAGLTSDLDKVITNYRQGVSEDKQISLYQSMNPKGVNDLINLEVKYGINRNELNAMDNTTKLNTLKNKGLSDAEISYYMTKNSIVPFNQPQGTIYGKATPKAYIKK